MITIMIMMTITITTEADSDTFGSSDVKLAPVRLSLPGADFCRRVVLQRMSTAVAEREKRRPGCAFLMSKSVALYAIQAWSGD
jgi:hypothetical protein